MIVTPKDVDGLRQLLTRLRDGTETRAVTALAALFGSRLYPALTCGFDEIRFEPIEVVMQDKLESYREFTDNPYLEWHFTARSNFEWSFTRQAFRSVTGAWYRFRYRAFTRDGFEGLALYRLHVNDGSPVRILTVEELLK